MKNLSILGASGSIGRQALEVCDWHPDDLHIVAMTANQDWRFLAAMAETYRPELVSIGDERHYPALRAALKNSSTQVLAGVEGLCAAAALGSADIVLAAISGMAGLQPLLAAIESGKQIALANKEALVAAGQVVMQACREKGITIRPVDSEHSALWQALAGEQESSIAKLILTASGGAFRDLSQAELATVTPAAALRHPNWRMGAKITIDCATMVNKGLEVIEAHWLFSVPYEKIDVVVHPQSIVHSLVAFQDGSVKAQMGLPDMRLPIQYALFEQQRPAAPVPALDLAEIGRLDFRQPDHLRFPALNILRAAGMAGGTAPAYLNAANEVLVEAFLNERIEFPLISSVLDELLSAYQAQPADQIEAVYAADAAGRADAGKKIWR